MDESPLSRRQWLAALGAGGVSLLGWFVFSGDSSSTTGAPSLRSVWFNNEDREPHQVAVMVRVGEEIIHWETHTIEDTATTSIPNPRVGTPEPFAVGVRLENGATDWADSSDVEWVAVDGVTPDHECIQVFARISRDGEDIELVRMEEPPERCFDRTDEDTDG
ncbi:hypothetical protein [Halorhabdus sp. BNX81]|uniref:hypothetical protein n=1 Tax=Halorhabdus sp. BNX81 TaxID=2980181 RepID=UPI0023DCFF95|nr:hypothetical protein [Halorhabdus sp. BNX81]